MTPAKERESHACYTNDQMNDGAQAWNRVGSCECDGRCCRFFSLETNQHSDQAYCAGFGQLVEDQWKPNDGLLILKNSACGRQGEGGKCSVFQTAEFPEVCRQFPSTPHDGVYRYLEQIGTPCGFRFVDAVTGEPWDLARRDKWRLDDITPESLSKLECVKGMLALETEDLPEWML